MGRRKSRSQRRAQPVPPSPAETRAAPSPPPDSPPSAPEPLPSAPLSRPVPALVVLATACLAALLHSPDPGHPFPALVDLSRGLTVGAALFGALALSRPRLPARLAPVAPTASALAVILGVLALSALFGRHPPAFRPLSGAHADLLSLCPEWLWVLTALTLPHATSGRARPLHLGALALSALLFIVPDAALGQSRHTLEALTEPARAPALLVGLLTVLGGALSFALPARHTLSPRLRRAAPHAPAALAAALLLGGLIAGDLVAALLAASLVLLVANAAPALFPAQDATPAPRPGRVPPPEAIALAIVLGVWFLIKVHALVPTHTDDNIYFYMANRLSDGVFPYVDYFFAHPPMHVLLPGVVFTVFGFSFEFAKLIPLLACAITGLALWAIARRHLDRVTALLGLALFLFAAEVLKASSNMNGVNLTVMWLALGLWSALSHAPRRAGAFYGLAATTGFYAMGPVLAALAIGHFRPRRDGGGDGGDGDPDAPPARIDRGFGLRQTLSFIAVFGAINLLFLVLASETFLDGVYRYHGEKFFQDPRMVEIFGGDVGFPLSIFHNIGVMLDGKAFNREVFYQSHLWLGALALPLALLLGAVTRHGPKAGLLRLVDPRRLWAGGPAGAALHLWLIALALFIQFAMFRELYSFYFVLIYPFLAFSTAATLSLVARHLAALTGRARLLALPSLAVLALPLLHGPVSSGHIRHFSGELDRIGQRNSYTYTEAPILSGPANLAGHLFWSDWRLRGDNEPGYRQYLWSKKRTFDAMEDISAYVRERTGPEDAIAGASTIAPLVALLSDRRIAAEEVDTNNKRFKTGLLSEEDYWRSICADRLRFIVASPKSYFTRAKLEAMPLIQRHFKPARVFTDHGINYKQPMEIALFEAIAPPGEGPVCTWETR